MSYANKTELPESVKESLPEEAQDIYLAAFNNAWEFYDTTQEDKAGASREETAHRIAWSAVKEHYENINGSWQRRE